MLIFYSACYPYTQIRAVIQEWSQAVPKITKAWGRKVCQLVVIWWASDYHAFTVVVRLDKSGREKGPRGIKPWFENGCSCTMSFFLSAAGVREVYCRKRPSLPCWMKRKAVRFLNICSFWVIGKDGLPYRGKNSTADCIVQLRDGKSLVACGSCSHVAEPPGRGKIRFQGLPNWGGALAGDEKWESHQGYEKAFSRTRMDLDPKLPWHPWCSAFCYVSRVCMHGILTYWDPAHGDEYYWPRN